MDPGPKPNATSEAEFLTRQKAASRRQPAILDNQSTPWICIRVHWQCNNAYAWISQHVGSYEQIPAHMCRKRQKEESLDPHSLSRYIYTYIYIYNLHAKRARDAPSPTRVSYSCFLLNKLMHVYVFGFMLRTMARSDQSVIPKKSSRAPKKKQSRALNTKVPHIERQSHALKIKPAHRKAK